MQPESTSRDFLYPVILAGDDKETSMSTSSRRTFMAASAAFSLGRVLGANEKINIGIVGIGGRGNDHIKSYATLPDARIVALCDVNQAALERGQASRQKAHRRTAQGLRRHAEGLRRQRCRRRLHATPNHWHALATIWACQAGKDVYVEKPACHNVFEGQQHDRRGAQIQPHGADRLAEPQHGAQDQGHATAARGRHRQGISWPRASASSGATPSDTSPTTPVPPGVDWDMFLGPAPMRAFNELRFKYNWHWFWDTGNGDIGNQGVHEMDIARWGLGKPAWPKSVVSTGGKFVYNDDQETPNTQFATFDYGDKELACSKCAASSPAAKAISSKAAATTSAISSSAPMAG